jgi:hypothetical protein
MKTMFKIKAHALFCQFSMLVTILVTTSCSQADNESDQQQGNMVNVNSGSAGVNEPNQQSLTEDLMSSTLAAMKEEGSSADVIAEIANIAADNLTAAEITAAEITAAEITAAEITAAEITAAEITAADNLIAVPTDSSDVTVDPFFPAASSILESISAAILAVIDESTNPQESVIAFVGLFSNVIKSALINDKKLTPEQLKQWYELLFKLLEKSEQDQEILSSLAAKLAIITGDDQQNLPDDSQSAGVILPFDPIASLAQALRQHDEGLELAEIVLQQSFITGHGVLSAYDSILTAMQEDGKPKRSKRFAQQLESSLKKLLAVSQASESIDHGKKKARKLKALKKWAKKAKKILRKISKKYDVPGDDVAVMLKIITQVRQSGEQALESEEDS